MAGKSGTPKGSHRGRVRPGSVRRGCSSRGLISRSRQVYFACRFHREEKLGAENVRRSRGAATADPNWETVTAAPAPLLLNPDDNRRRHRSATRDLPAGVNAAGHTPPARVQPRRESPDVRGRQNVSQPFLAVASVDAPTMLVARAELVEMVGCDHWPQYEQPERFHAAPSSSSAE